MMRDLPAGTVTFMFTDVEGSTRLLNALGPDEFADVLEAHQALVREVVHETEGVEVGTEGDAFFVAFASAPAAVRAAADVQRRLAAGEGGGDRGLAIRIGLHTGEVKLRGDDYVGIDVHRAARISSAGHGGQILVSEQTRSLAEHDLPEGVSFVSLGTHRLKDFEHPERLYQIHGPGLRSAFPPLKTLDRPMGNLPVQLTSFVGRDRELEAARRALAETRLLTLTGPGGTGKTRLSIQLADAVQEEFDDGAWFAPLATVTDPAAVPSAIADALGLSEARGEHRPPIQRVTDYLRDREALLVLDNFEQIVEAAGAVTGILRSAPGVKVVATTREALRTSGEREFPVPTLALPDPDDLPDLTTLSQYEAVALFIDRARAVRPDFEVTNDNAPAVAEICARLDGLPLAIELAAARIRVLTPDAMLARLGDRLALLSKGSRDLPARQQTLRQTIAWSQDLLSEPEQRLFARLGVFSGGWALEQAEPVCGSNDLGLDVLEGVESLADKSLVTVRAERAESRFGMLETIREFSLGRLEEGGEGDAIRRRHAEAFLDLAERAEPHLTRRESKRWLDRLETEHDNIGAALQWAIGAGDARIALSLVASLWRFWQMRGHLQGARAWVDRVLGMPAAQGVSPERARALDAAGGVAYWQFDWDAVRNRYREAFSLAEKLDDPALLANAYIGRAYTHSDTAPTPESFADFERALALFDELRDDVGKARALWEIGSAYIGQAYESGTIVEQARPSLEAALELAGQRGDIFQAGWSLFLLGFVEQRANDREAAAERLKASLRSFAEMEDVTGILFNLQGLARLALEGGQPERGFKLRAAATLRREQSGTGLIGDPEQQAEFEKAIAELDQQLVAEAQAEGRAMTTEEAVGFALEDPDYQPSKP